MTDAPERMYVFPKAGWFNAGASTHPVKAAGAKDVEYNRADLDKAAEDAAYQQGYAQAVEDAPR